MTNENLQIFIYDEEITGIKQERRDRLHSMIIDCEKGKNDFIIIKLISQFARNNWISGKILSIMRMFLI